MIARGVEKNSQRWELFSTLRGPSLAWAIKDSQRCFRVMARPSPPSTPMAWAIKNSQRCFWSALLARSASVPAYEVVDQLTRDAEPWRDLRRQLVRGKPSGLGDFRRVCGDLAGGPLGRETNHQRSRERPRLTAEVADVGDEDSRLFLNFPLDRMLERFADFDEARQRAEEWPREARIAREQGTPVTFDEHDDCGRQPRIGVVATGGARANALCVGALGGCSATPAEPEIAIPSGNSQRATCNREILV